MPSPIAEVATGETLTATNFNSLPRGYVAASKKTSDQGSISTETDITDLSVTFTATNGRYYKTTVQIDVSPTVSTDTAIVKITDGSNNELMRSVLPFSQSNSHTANITYYEKASSTGSLTRKVRILRASGTGTFTAQAASVRPGLILVEDMGN